MVQPPIIEVNQLTKTYQVHEREPGLRQAFRSLFKRQYRAVTALHPVTFSVAPGERVGLIGPNGAGKTTTIKMLAGLLEPGGGTARVNGFIPGRRQPEFLRSISVILGNKSQMMWDIPPLDTFRVLGEIYAVPRHELEQRIEALTEMLDLRQVLNRPVRNLSLGERMKCELTAGLLHNPRVLFLDEPTLGLDVSVQIRLRQFIAETSDRSGAAVLVTSHTMADLTALCERVLLLKEGRLIYDGSLKALAHRVTPYKEIHCQLDHQITSAQAVAVLPPGSELTGHEDHQLTLRIPRSETARTTALLLEALPIFDLSVVDAPIETVIDQVYQGGGL